MNTAMIKPQWGPLTIALMVLGFVVWWPLGLAMLAYILWGEMFGGSAEKAEAWAQKSKAWCRDQNFNHNHHKHYGNWRNSSGNAAFDDYREREMRRLDEERRKLDEERREFDGYVRNLRRARDQEEFDRFRRERDERRKSAGSDTIDL